nr:MAG TPA: hypothetical protein [Bacteriophage sp.]
MSSTKNNIMGLRRRPRLSAKYILRCLYKTKSG